MSALLDKINTADRLATMVRQGFVMPLTMVEQLVGIGFYDIDIEKRTACIDGLRLTLRENYDGAR